ncbi:hypothetical protein AYI69_g4105 [Smittium culicis]|uniref:Uncharacterized protein n=1 Tax=Smittium culicis TaxID=133412 RepID=A0A1R1YGI4_9FUNG|nr:hypothetical protein AYI69_g4105 [Smittium culicis]
MLDVSKSSDNEGILQILNVNMLSEEQVESNQCGQSSSNSELAITENFVSKLNMVSANVKGDMNKPLKKRSDMQMAHLNGKRKFIRDNNHHGVEPRSVDNYKFKAASAERCEIFEEIFKKRNMNRNILKNNDIHRKKVASDIYSGTFQARLCLCQQK